jgi:phospholipid transport system substrate-binding protein
MRGITFKLRHALGVALAAGFITAAPLAVAQGGTRPGTPATTSATASGTTARSAVRTPEQIEVEAFIASQSNGLIEALANRTQSAAARSLAFNLAMESFTDVRAVGRFVLGRYGTSVQGSDFDRFLVAFREYAMTTYESRFDQYRGSRIEVVNSVQRRPGDVVVTSMVRGRANGEDLPVSWRVLRRTEGWRVVDVEVFGVWLGIEQRAQFEAILQQANGRVDPLIGRLNGMTARMRQNLAQPTARG